MTQPINAPWAILPDSLETLSSVLTPKATDQQIQAVFGNRPAAPSVEGRVGLLPLMGVVTQRYPYGANLEAFLNGFRAMMANPQVKDIILHIDSPGGSVYGTAEAAEEIYQARGTKHIVAVADSLAASAAYWIATAASEVVVTPGGEVGSIGVFSMHVDQSGLDAATGIKVSFISAGKFKVEGNPHEALGAEARDYEQSRVNDYYNQFVAAVAKHRGTTPFRVRSGFGEGRVVGAKQAVASNMADRVGTFRSTAFKLSEGGRRLAAIRRDLARLSPLPSARTVKQAREIIELLS